MGQKVNPNILRLGTFYDWDSTYTEKKSSELAQLSFNDLNIRNFISKTLKDNGMLVSHLKIHYTNTSINILVEYFLNIESNLSQSLKSKKVKLLPEKKIKKKSRILKKKTINYFRYYYLKYQTLKLKNLKKKNLEIFKKTSQLVENSLKLRRIEKVKVLNSRKTVQKNTTINKILINSFIEKLFLNFKLFNNKKIDLNLTFKQINKNTKQFITKNQIKIIKRIFINLRKYKKSKFFQEGLNIIFSTIQNKNSSVLLAEFISNQLKKLKRHNFFLRFIKASLSLFINKRFSNLKGIKIKIKGRLNGRPRARHRIINIKKGISTLTLKSNIDYSESTSFTPKGTLGVKVWLERE